MMEGKSRSLICVATVLLLFPLVPMAHIERASSTMDVGVVNIDVTRYDVIGGDYFTENTGQWDERVRFALRGSHGTTYFTRNSIVHDLRCDGGGCVVRLSFGDACPFGPEGIDEVGFGSNYFLGNDPDGWVVGARSFREVLYEDVWPGADVRYYLVKGQLKYDVILDERAATSTIRFRIEGQSEILCGVDRFEIRTSAGPSLLDSGLIAFYEDGERVAVSFKVIDDVTYGFEVEKEPGRRMIIDPLLYVTALGGSSQDLPTDFERDEDGELYFYGMAFSYDFPNTTGAYDHIPEGNGYSVFDLYVTKMDRDSSDIIFSTFIGGWTCEISDDMDVDEKEDIYLTGFTYGWEFPTTPGAFQRTMNGASSLIFVTKLAANGSALVYSTFVGGRTINMGSAIVARNGNACVGGHSLAYDFPTHMGPMGGVHGYAVYFELDHNGSNMVDYISIDGYLGEWFTDMVLDNNGDVILGGYTASPMIPVTPHSVQLRGTALVNSIIAKYKPGERRFEFVSEFGADMDTYIKGVEVDQSNNIYFTGYSRTSGSQPYPVVPGCLNTGKNHSVDMFISKIDPNGTRLLASATLGGTYSEAGGGIDIDANGNVYVAGEATDLFPAPGLTKWTSNGVQDAIVLKLDPGLTEVLNLSTIGGSGIDRAFWCRLDDNDRTLIGGQKSSADFPVSNKFNLSDTYGAFIAFMRIESKPSEPTDPSAEEGDGFVELGWSPPIDDGNSMITNYSIYRGRDPGNMTLLSILNDTLSFVDEEAGYGIFHYYSISAINSHGEGPKSLVVSNLSTTLPAPPRDLKVVVDIGVITVTFEPPSFDGGSQVIKYSVYRDGEAICEIEDGPIEFSDLWIDLGVRYEYRATSWNKNGESVLSAPVVVRSKTFSSPPINLTCRQGLGLIDLRWEEPLDNGELDIKSYIVMRGTDPSVKEAICINRFDEVSYRDWNVRPGVRYYYEVLAMTSIGRSDPSEEVSIVAVDGPSSPVGLTASPGPGSVLLQWSFPEQVEGLEVLGANIYEGASVGRMTLLAFSEGMYTSYVHSDLKDDRAHHYSVTTVSNWGESAWSTIVSQRPSLAPSPPTRVTAVPDVGSVRVEWRPPSSNGNLPLIEYLVFKRPFRGVNEVVARTGGSVQGYVDTDVERGVVYTYSIRSVNALGESRTSEETTASGLFYPDPPTNLSVLPEGRGLTLRWDPPIYEGGTPVNTYIIHRGDEKGGTYIVERSSDEELSYYDGSVQGGIAYNYFILCSNDAGTSSQSMSVTSSLPTVPSEPTELKASLMGDYVVMGWEAPLSDGGSPILHYNLYRRDGNESPSLLSTIKGTKRIFVDNNISVGSTYVYFVTAVGKAGEGQASEEAMIELMVGPDEKGNDTFVLLYMVFLSVTIAVLAVILLVRRVGRHGVRTIERSEEE